MDAAPTLDAVVAAMPPACSGEVIGDGRIVVRGVTHDSRLVQEAMMFACLRGANTDGHAHAPEAVRRGATSLVVDHALPIGDVAQLIVPDVRRCLGWIAGTVYGSPSRALTVVGITGTNGKTTTSQLLAAILEASGRGTGIIGTLTGARTTPEAPALQAALAGFARDGDDAVVMEVSSHALELHRVDGTEFALGVFTNLGEDHLDLHGSMEAYFRAKARLFEPGRTKVGVVNVDDLHGQLLSDSTDIEIVPFSRRDATDVEVGAASVTMRWHDALLRVPLGGDFNVMNILAAATAADALGIDATTIAKGLADVGPVPGRFERVTAGPDAMTGDFDVIVDYAHTPESLASLLASARALTHGDGRVIVVFGCGGDRDTGKRPHMGAAAAGASDVTIVTSDNPRHEEPMAIIGAILDGVDPVTRSRLFVEPDRAAAIRLAVDAAGTGDIVVIAGKGHETTQFVGDRAVPFDDRLVAADAMRGRSS